jgi:hypothetical protein
LCKLKVISFTEQFESRATQRKSRNSGIQRALLEETKRIIKKAKSGSGEFRGPKAGKSAYFTNPEFSAAKLEKKNAQIT